MGTQERCLICFACLTPILCPIATRAIRNLTFMMQALLITLLACSLRSAMAVRADVEKLEAISMQDASKEALLIKMQQLEGDVELFGRFQEEKKRQLDTIKDMLAKKEEQEAMEIKEHDSEWLGKGSCTEGGTRKKCYCSNSGDSTCKTEGKKCEG